MAMQGLFRTLAKLLSEIRKISDTNDQFAKSLESCQEKIDENNTLIKAQDFEIRECVEEVEKLTTKCAALAKENEELKCNINKQKQYT